MNPAQPGLLAQREHSWRRVLVTGAAGLVGAILRAGLAGRHGELRLLDRRPMGKARPGEAIIVGDLLDRATIGRAVRDVDALIHLAGAPDPGDFGEMFATNVRGLYELFEGARNSGVRRIVFASTNHTYGIAIRSIACMDASAGASSKGTKGRAEDAPVLLSGRFLGSRWRWSRAASRRRHHGEGVLVDPPGPVDEVVPERRRGRVKDLLPSLDFVGVGKPIEPVEEQAPGSTSTLRVRIAPP